MKINLCFLCVFVLFQGAQVFAQEAVDSQELRSANGSVEFISNTAAPARIDTREQIMSLGSSPAAVIRGGAETAGALNRYFVIHRLHPAEFDKLDGDIFGLGASAGVDTIKNLRLIIQGYLQTAYSYSAQDAALLAQYITIYNAVYRNDRAYFTRRYKTPLLNDLTAGREGIALRFDQWPGQTLMVIPLQTAKDGSISAIDTTAISDNKVVDEMRKDDDKGIGSRQNMVDMKEREAEEAGKNAAKLALENAEEERKIAAEQQRVAAEQKKLADEQAQIEEAKKKATSDEERASLEAKEKALQKEQEDLKKEEDALADRKDKLDDNEVKAAAAKELADRKNEEAQRDREAISADQGQMIGTAKPAAAAPTGVLAVRLSGADAQRGTIIKVNPSSASTIQTSALNQISARSLVVTGGTALAVAGNGKTARLIEINTTTMESAKQGEDEVNPDTEIWASGNNLYAIIVSGGKNYLARFDKNLVKQAQSIVQVHRWASVQFEGDRILTQNEKGSVVSLKASDLSE